MIKVFYNEYGYYITGGGIEITRSCSPALNQRGGQIFQPIHHTYKILYLALKDISEVSVSNDIIVCGDTRIIDEINGTISPLDDGCKQWLEIIRRHIIPSIKPIVIFRKKSSHEINMQIRQACDKMLVTLDAARVENILKQEQEDKTVYTNTKKQKLISRLKIKWFGDNKNG